MMGSTFLEEVSRCHIVSYCLTREGKGEMDSADRMRPMGLKASFRTLDDSLDFVGLYGPPWLQATT